MEKRFFKNRVQIEKRGDGDAPVISGYAAVFHRAGDPGTEYKLFGNSCERIDRGAFDRAIAEDDVRALFNHSPDFVLGRNKAGTLRLSVDDIGLRYEIDPPDTQTARDVIESIRRGDVSGSSFAFRATDERWENDGTREIRTVLEVSLSDVGPVTYPAYEASTSEARSSYERWRGDQLAQDAEANRQRVLRLLDII